MYKTNLLNAIVENVIDGILVIDQNGIIQLVNPAVCKLFDYTANELLKQNVNILMSHPDKENHDKYLRRYQHTRLSNIIGIGRQITAIKKNGDTFPARLAVSETQYAGKTVFAGIIQDLSEEKKAKDKFNLRAEVLEQVVAERTHFLQNIVHTLEQAKEEVNTSLMKEKEVNRLKSRFVSIASHEFRTPLSSIQLSASLIEHYFDRLDKEKIFSHITKIKSAVGNLTDILNDFLSVEKIEDGKATPVYRELDLQLFLDDIIDGMKIQLKHGQQITYNHLSKNRTVILDTSMLQHILINLISNAIKYSGSNGSIQVVTDVNKKSCKIQVRDNGIGIPAEDQAHLFEAFFRARNTTEVQGTGLGLNIVKRYTDLMNGKISVQSNEDIGTVFTLVFPVMN